ncbi:unnamed protein product [Prorocentrum cordatum]|uniref:Uncharacterized protein n=1 Tax=Prorocentrum cordatum TaxID=2364126 RepID=A0ABN9VYK5_9DINO|nr:unnamed protein product [Polarella glacialis]
MAACAGDARGAAAARCPTPLRRLGAGAGASAQRAARERLQLRARERAISEAAACLAEAGERLLQIGGAHAAALGSCGVLGALGRAGLAFGALSDALDGGALLPGARGDGDEHDRGSRRAEAIDECRGMWDATAAAVEALAGRLRQPGEAERPQRTRGRRGGGAAARHFYIGDGCAAEPDAETEAAHTPHPAGRASSRPAPSPHRARRRAGAASAAACRPGRRRAPARQPPRSRPATTSSRAGALPWTGPSPGRR